MALPRQSPYRYGLVASIVVHAALLGLIAFAGRSLLVSARGLPSPFQGGGGGGSGGGNGQIRYVSLAPPPPPSEARPRTPTPVDPPAVVPPPQPEPEEQEETPAEEVVTRLDSTTVVQADTVAGTELALGEGVGKGAEGLGPGTGGGSGGGKGGGIGTGVGTGSGPGAGGGGGLARDPEPRQLLLPPEVKDKNQRGTFVNVTFHVTAEGRVLRVEVDPEPSDRKYAREFRSRMEGYLFRPARSAEGRPVAGVFRIRVGL